MMFLEKKKKNQNTRNITANPGERFISCSHKQINLKQNHKIYLKNIPTYRTNGEISISVEMLMKTSSGII
ncbi:hypothetical protein HanRHA438_Chr07g0314801 [Helianthus annuus]|nr:hypothetical protein HanIR_Chr07g0329941 [Helianthus annuus]KAJ0908831.1 hypothetical protein HanRHA438_Chr07g0314801 [Helianthus annuus]